VATRVSVADEIAANEMQRVRAENSRGGIPLATEAALEQYEDTWRTTYDRTRKVEAVVLESETTVLVDAVEAAIVAAETLPSERQQHGSSTEKGLSAAILEELIGQRLMREFGAMTIADLAEHYAHWTDGADRTAVRAVEAALTNGGLGRLGLRPDPDRDAEAILQLQRAVAARRKARVAPSLYVLRDRVRGLRTIQRQELIGHLEGGRGIARRPRPTTVHPR
jgi:hypothetical protein